MTITLTREEAQQVLVVLEYPHAFKPTTHAQTAALLRARLAQPEPEPQEVIAKWIKTNTEHREWYICPKCSHQTPRFKDEWQGLTAKDLSEIPPSCYEGAIWADAKLKEKNT